MKAWTTLLLLAVASPAAAQSLVPGPNQAGRYEMQPVDGGVARLDTVTGDVSLCRVESGKLRCRPSEDENAPQARGGDDASPQDNDDPPQAGDDARRSDPGSDPSDDDPKAESGTSGRADHDDADDTDAELDKAIGRAKRVFRAFRDIAREFEHDDRAADGTAEPDRT